MKYHCKRVVSALDLWKLRCGTWNEWNDYPYVKWFKSQDEMIAHWIKFGNGQGSFIARDIPGAEGPKEYAWATLRGLCGLMQNKMEQLSMYESVPSPEDADLLKRWRQNRLELWDRIDNCSDDEDGEMDAFIKRQFGSLRRPDYEHLLEDIDAMACSVDLFADLEVYYATNPWLKKPEDFILRESIILGAVEEFLYGTGMLDYRGLDGQVHKRSIRTVIQDSSKALGKPGAKISRHYLWKIYGLKLGSIMDAGAVMRCFEAWILSDPKRWGTPGVDNPFYVFDERGNLIFVFDKIYTPHRFLRLLGSGKDQERERIMRPREGFDNMLSPRALAACEADANVVVFGRASYTTPYEVKTILDDPDYVRSVSSVPEKKEILLRGDPEDQAISTDEELEFRDRLYIMSIFEPDGITPARSIGRAMFFFNPDGSIASLNLKPGERVVTAMANVTKSNALNIGNILDFGAFMKWTQMEWTEVKGEKGVRKEMERIIMGNNNVQDQDVSLTLANATGNTSSLDFEKRCPKFVVTFMKNVIEWIKQKTIQDLFSSPEQEGYVTGVKRPFDPVMDTGQPVQKKKKLNCDSEIETFIEAIINEGSGSSSSGPPSFMTQLEERDEEMTMGGEEEDDDNEDKRKKKRKGPRPLDEIPIGELAKSYHSSKPLKMQNLEPYNIKFDPMEDVIRSEWNGYFCPIMYLTGRQRSSEKNKNRARKRDDPVRNADIFHTSNHTGVLIDMGDPSNPRVRFSCHNPTCAASHHAKFSIPIPPGVRNIFSDDINNLYGKLNSVLTFDLIATMRDTMQAMSVLSVQ